MRFLTGTDEHAPKNVKAAGGSDVAAFVAANAARFRELAGALDVSFDFIRTSADPRHGPAVEWIWRACEASGDLYRRHYEGLYCAGCEEFVDGPCGEHDTPPEPVAEQSWFFRLSRYEDAQRELPIVPDERAREVRAFLDGGLHDISVSRSRARTKGWGIPVRGDPEQVIYVWFDALVWPAMLLSAGLPLPSTLFVHGCVTVGARKIGKSLGNAVDPIALVDRYGVDAVRWWLLREVPRVGEADFTEERLVKVANRDLAHGIGNLVHRVATLAAGLEIDASADALTAAAELPNRIDHAVDAYDLRAATGAILETVAVTNRYLERTEPWRLRSVQRSTALAPAWNATVRIIAELTAFVPVLSWTAQERLDGESRSVCSACRRGTHRG